MDSHQGRFARGLGKLAWLVDLLIRGVMFHVFFMSGLHKWTHWSDTVKVFQADYTVSFLTPNTTALIGTGAEILLAVLLLLGLLSRVSAFSLLIINSLTITYYPMLQAEIGHAHLLIHCYWSVMLLVIVCHGPGAISLDALFCKLRHKKNRGFL